jgi:hypothetical protein
VASSSLAANLLKLFHMFVTDEAAEYARMFVPKKHIQPGLIFEGKARSLPYREFRDSTRLG